ncbi:hypothetical protein SERLA73DRAFT_112545 [Serpula lacrymans var. lacrymans S7.3]|uniref:Mitochondrial adapter protein MCP1 transmembrane domain-containing protein n=2 Tax=Serpula lacrymans var. lacrymans TaxID=341189 RepID=F8Q6S0_SERL3|nr:uncharacterized protein SERLADRAFT_357594 [Serpula lacrymans var. lacrymans S7.9]EGN96308.1 hypothetical protein SERLA73DRAFT_112545 [Serpula lacrymans var. lacrymans S7.3]EGO21844.1 hypothetical protein SERLADRAFT_357594 [Serpula lacrymans var. lacrymans S7.9]
MASNPSNDPNGQPKAVTYLTRIAHGSAPFITTFLLIHLSAPMVANIGGSSLSSQVMLLGREYYQTSFGEKYLVLVPLGIHVASGIAKRILSPPQRKPRSLLSILSVTAYAALSVFVPIHFFTHRISPSDPAAPILAVGPAELDYEYVKFALHTWPWRSWGLYAGLVGCVSLHAAEGMGVIFNTWFRGGKKSWCIPKTNTRRLVAACVTLPVLSGLFVFSREPLMTLSSFAGRFEAAFTQSWIYRL